MGALALTLLTKDYDQLMPLACGDVTAEGIDLTLVRDTAGALDRTLDDRSVQAGELSFSRHLIRLAEGDRDFVGIPIWPTRAFRHRRFMVRRGSPLRALNDLEGRRIGTNEWPATGNTWSRAALREQGIGIDRVDWWVGSVDGEASARDQGPLPSNVQRAENGRTLVEMLLADELDALMTAKTPRGFNAPDSPIVRLFPDYRAEEEAFYRRTGVYPGMHIIGIRRGVFERDPWVARALYQALDQSRIVWERSRRRLADTTPWLLDDYEKTVALMGENWQPNGVEPNRKMIRWLCEEELAQGLIREPLDPGSVFAEFEAVMRG